MLRNNYPSSFLRPAAETGWQWTDSTVLAVVRLIGRAPKAVITLASIDAQGCREFRVFLGCRVKDVSLPAGI
jgi:hypothetical protein